jgi:hypothetical protein
MEHADKDKIAARFAQMWNEIVTSFRGEDLIDNRLLYCMDGCSFLSGFMFSA